MHLCGNPRSLSFCLTAMQYGCTEMMIMPCVALEKK